MCKNVADDIVEKYVYGDSEPEVSSKECSSKKDIGCCSASTDSKSSCCK